MSFGLPRQGHKVTTYEGVAGFSASLETELLLLVAGSLSSGDTFYEKDESRNPCPVSWIRNGEWRTRAPLACLASPSDNEGALEKLE